jgi:hypothetical protein
MPTTVEIGPQVIPILDLGAQYRSLHGEVLAAEADSLRRALATCAAHCQPTGASMPIS